MKGIRVNASQRGDDSDITAVIKVNGNALNNTPREVGEVKNGLMLKVKKVAVRKFIPMRGFWKRLEGRSHHPGRLRQLHNDNAG